MSSLEIVPVRTDIFRPGLPLADFVARWIAPLEPREGDIVAVTSKIVSVAENRFVPVTDIGKTELVRREADVFLGEIGYGCSLTIKEGLLIPSAGIDESNSENGNYVLYPADPYRSARELRTALAARFGVRNLGIILTDSHTNPLRQGVTGVGLAYAGFRAVRDLIGEADLFGRELKMTKMNLLDGLSAAAVLLMGEARETRPLALLRGAEVEFMENIDPQEILMPMESDLYAPLYRHLLGT